jgi:hypothetical protein
MQSRVRAPRIHLPSPLRLHVVLRIEVRTGGVRRTAGVHERQLVLLPQRLQLRNAHGLGHDAAPALPSRGYLSLLFTRKHPKMPSDCIGMLLGRRNGGCRLGK